MKKVAGFIALVGLGLSLVPAFMVFSGSMPISLYKDLMLAGTVLWFVAGSVWFSKGNPSPPVDRGGS